MRKTWVFAFILVALSVLGLKIVVNQNALSVKNKEKKYAKTLSEHHNAIHKELTRKDCYLNSLSSSVGLVLTEDTKVYKDSIFAVTPILYYCLSAESNEKEIFNGHEVYQVNILFKDRQIDSSSIEQRESFRNLLRVVRNDLHKLNSEKGLEQGFKDFDIVTVHTFAKIKLFTERDIELLKKYE